MCFFLPAVMSTNQLCALTPSRLRPGEWALSPISFFLYTGIYTGKHRLRHIFPNILKEKKKVPSGSFKSERSLFPMWSWTGQELYFQSNFGRSHRLKTSHAALHSSLIFYYFPSCLFILVFAGMPCLQHSYKTLHVCSALPVSRPLSFLYFRPCVWLSACLLSQHLFVFFNAE